MVPCSSKNPVTPTTASSLSSSSVVAGFLRSTLPRAIALRSERGKALTSTLSPTASAISGETPGPTPPLLAPAMARCSPIPSPQNASSPKVAYRKVFRPSRTCLSALISVEKSLESLAPAVAVSSAASIAATICVFIARIPVKEVSSQQTNASAGEIVPRRLTLPLSARNLSIGRTNRRLMRPRPRGENPMHSSARSIKHGSFVIERRFDFDPSQVYRAWTESHVKARWFCGPAGKWVEVVREMNVRVGGHDRLIGKFTDGSESRFESQYFDVVPEKRLVYAYDMYWLDKKISVSLASVEFVLAGKGTKLVLAEQHAFLDGYEDSGSRERGTRALLDNLAIALGGGDARQPRT